MSLIESDRNGDDKIEMGMSMSETHLDIFCVFEWDRCIDGRVFECDRHRDGCVCEWDDGRVCEGERRRDGRV